MAGPRLTNFNNGLEASSDSDDEDKLHIVEEDSLLEPEAPDADGSALPDSHDAAIAVLPHNGSWNGVHWHTVYRRVFYQKQDPQKLVTVRSQKVEKRGET
ncbi:unnamed protein product [Menidia menidia]|uniref:(Atlantic silverside) hypothetical protein n=1 Tax=Menidia menidia TaxID=238744 RepID=A0A8S4ATF8_9TELE|nr:unnamed protein product [Menidia menidia]